MATLFERLGGFAKVSRMVSALYDKALDEPELQRYFAGIDMRRLIDHQTKFIASLIGGPASYSDEELARVHAHLNISGAAFDEMAALLRETLEDFDVPDEDIEAVHAAFRRRRHLIVADV